jgi:hypothetical protein
MIAPLQPFMGGDPAGRPANAGTPFGEFTSRQSGVPTELKIEPIGIGSVGCNRGVA